MNQFDHEAGLPKVRFGIAPKLAVCLVVSAALILAVFAYINLQLQRKHSERLVTLSAERLGDILLQSTRHEMLRNDREALYEVIRDIGREPGLERVRIFNKEGRISFSTDPVEVGRVVDKRAEACYACHAEGVPLERPNRAEQFRIFQNDSNERVLAMIRAVRNEPGCSASGCHTPAQTVLGVLDVQLSLAAVDAQVASNRQWLLAFSIGSLILLCAVSGAFVYLVLHRPIRALMAGTRRVAEGELHHRIGLESNDELGALALSFNRMTYELEAAQAEITEWNRELESRVERKTEELQRAHAYLAGSEKMAGIGKLAATVAHEVNNPLFGILTYSRLSLKELERCAGLDDAARAKLMQQLSTIERESKRCGDLVKNLLTYARQAARTRELTNLNEVVERALVLVRNQYKLKGVHLETQLEPGLPSLVCDPGQIQQILIILLTNAAEATGEGGEVMLKTELAMDGSGLSIRVEDNGGGIPSEVMPQIFEPFFTTKDDQQRTGLGLAVAQSIAEQHGGTIQVESEYGRGATFTVTVPLEPPTAIAEPLAGQATGGMR